MSLRLGFSAISSANLIKPQYDGANGLEEHCAACGATTPQAAELNIAVGLPNPNPNLPFQSILSASFQSGFSTVYHFERSLPPSASIESYSYEEYDHMSVAQLFVLLTLVNLLVFPPPTHKRKRVRGDGWGLKFSTDHHVW